MAESSSAPLKDRLQKFKELQFRRKESRKLNYQEVVEEDRRAKLPPNYEKKNKWAQYIIEQEEKKQEAAAKGEDYNRVKLLDVTAEDAEKWERMKKKKNPDPGFSSYEDAAIRQYDRLTKKMKPDMEAYKREKEKMGEAFYPTKDTIIHGMQEDSQEAIDNMVENLEKVIEKHSKFSRRRRYNDDADINYINERNKNFNKKLERFYGQYTAEIKQNLERGTAV
ncbi:pre-mRNA-splicing factor SYF2-like [Argiope bruennichi]|uniref:Pre-mRNA-splicing factor SYF2 n=1 Tax=Argiope bruennichi TaxID=94029 RepID=A0A8T0EFK7_ARGBR|nr:pre-mRNA-splicing factor SYF2-like [Argiope bruennichi]KAF8771649.1 Pre-mRNA-splicing factor syf2 like protein [Argiope bruennichi]